ncbi:pseudopodium-enriched atypical kinase 1-like protein [Labeo rohita]|uniref:Pseudopodium-enriched atypical kinase 1-like protein n=1 Tax=Labeo rohita TaxID=84645 RepID=A0A498MPS5_LABRO|nr:inactive tyrosine-protein kinase PEAK1 [Labeo rohita]RXN02917.1 pseudopodium-enriched atypical kinase 1-like protein [Labeo rohita]RXN20606.1 pseudopodium-enriched atypical kinase 1-like protein [Labeo rohita]
MHQGTDCALLGASGGTSPPALPIKQRRSRSSSGSIRDLELKVGDLLLSGPQTPVSPFTEVFTPTYCNAVHCPIHHRYENHQVRFFSEETPPPVPKKSLKRTQSLPVETVDPPYDDHTRTCNYENPLYMITPFHNTLALQEEEVHVEEYQGLPLHNVTFDTPDEQLQSVFRSFQSHEQVSMGIQECYLQFLKSMLQNIESSIYLNNQEMEMAKTCQPNDFILCEQQWTDAFYLVRCSKVPGRLFSAKVHRGDSVSDCTISMPHPNTEQGLVHFPQSTAPNQTSTSEHAQTTPEPSHVDTSEVVQQQTVADLLEKGVSVTVVRDFPLGTLEDFVEEGQSLHTTLPEVYERRLCLLALQLVLGLQQLGRFKVIHKELKPQSMTLVWPSIMRKVEDSRDYPSEMKKGSMNTDTCVGTPVIIVSEEQTDNERTKSEVCQTLWEKLGTPRLVLESHSEKEVLQEPTSQEFQFGTLLRYCLHLSDTCSSVWKVPHDTPYTPGLLWLVTQLTSEKPALSLADVVGVLQALLWGPRQGLFQQNQMENSVLSNWLLLKRSLLVLKLAEKGLFQDQPGLDWEDYLCLQYLSLTDPETMRSITERMRLQDFVRPA